MREGSIKIALRFACDNCKAIIYTLKKRKSSREKTGFTLFFGSFL
jgi:hypothetical protein